MSGLLLLLCLFVGCLLCAQPAQSEIVYHDLLDQDPLQRGWSTWTPAGTVAQPTWTEAIAHTGNRCLTVIKGRWISPFFPIKPGEYYLVEAYARAEGIGYLHSWFYDGNSTKLEPGVGGDAIKGGICGQLYESVQWEKNGLLFRAMQGVTHAQLAFEPRNDKAISIDDVTITHVTPQEAAAYLDGVYQTVPPGRYAFPRDRWDLLPKTRAIYEQGGALRLIMLGSSNINDMFGGYADLTIMRRNPKVQIDAQASVRGSTGCNFYQEPENLQAYVIDQKPDLLLIECSDFGSTVEAIRNVIRRTREQSATEIVLATQGSYREEWVQPIDPNGTDFHANLLRMAAEERVGVMDLGRAYSQYIVNCGQPSEWFMRDKYHYNDRGKQVLAHFIADYLTLEP